MNCVRFRLNIPTDDILRYYTGDAQSISVIADDGRRVEFPAMHLRQYVSHDGVIGYFEICFDDNNRFQSIQRLGD